MKAVKPTEFSRQIEKALIRAGKNARELSRRTNTPFVIWQNGRMVGLNARSAKPARRRAA